MQIAGRRKARENILLLVLIEEPKQNSKFQPGKMRQNIKREVIAYLLV